MAATPPSESFPPHTTTPPPTRRRVAIVSGIMTAIVLAALTVVVWLQLNNQAHEASQRIIDTTTEQTALRLEDFLNYRLSSVETITMDSEHIEASDEAQFRRDAHRIHQRFDGLQAINWVTPAGTILWAVPEGPNRAAQGRSLIDHPIAEEPYRTATATLTARATIPTELFQGGRGVATYIPVMHRGELLGLVSGVFRINTLIEAALRHDTLDAYAIRIADGDHIVYESEDFATLHQSAMPHGHTEMPLLDRRWRLEVIPRAAAWEDLDDGQRPLLVLGFLLAIVGGVLVYVTLARHRQRLIDSEAALVWERRLQEAQRLEALGRLSRGLTHDLNNLVNTVVGHAEFIRLDEELPAEHIESAEAILAASERANELTAQLMSFSRAEETADSHDATIELAPFMERWRRLIRGLTPRTINLTIEESPAHVLLSIDGSALSRVLVNLSLNAVDAMEDHGTLHVGIKLIEQTDPPENIPEGTWAILSVRDSGPGMPPEVRDRIFDPFFTTKPPGKGTGLGLSIVYGLIQSAGGFIDLTTEPGCGTTFDIYLPAEHTAGYDGDPSHTTSS